MIPGSDLLASALGMIATQEFQWHRFTGLTNNPAGLQVPVYAAPVPVDGSVQAASKVLVQQLGLQWSKNYLMVYAEVEFTDPERNKAGDLIDYAGRRYQAETLVPWFAQDGWTAALFVEVRNA